MLTLRVSTLYAIASGETPRPGTIGFRFNAGGSAVFATGKLGASGTIVVGDSVSITAVAGEVLETGPVFSATTLPAGTYGIIGR